MKNSAFQTTCLIIDTFIPNWITKAVYYPSFLVFKLLCTIHFRENLSASYLRNSYALDYFTFGLSDFDFGVVLKKRISTKKWLDFISHFHLLKKINPHWSEINLYIEDELENLILFINPIELKRDPYLSKRYQLNASTEEKFVFLNRSFFTNLNNWHFESKKMKKMKKYFSLCNLDYIYAEDSNLFLKKNFDLLLLTVTQKKYPQFVILFHSLFLQTKDILWETPTKETKILFPQNYLWFERNEDDESFLAQLEESDKKVIISQMKWEVWGLTTQMYWFAGKKDYSLHISRVKKVLELLNQENTVIKKIDYFLSVFDHLN